MQFYCYFSAYPHSSADDYSSFVYPVFNTVCQQKGPLAKHENRKFPKPFQGGLGMLVGPPLTQKFWPQLHRPNCTANFKCYF